MGLASNGKVDVARSTGSGDDYTDQREVPHTLDAQGRVCVNVTAGSIEVDPTNLATSAKQDAQTALLAGGLPAALGAHNGLVIEGVASGTAVPVSAASLPLPSGAATETTLAEIDGAVLDIDNGIQNLIAAVKDLAGFETLTAIDYSGGDQTSITDGSTGIWINTAGTLKIDTWAGATGVTFTIATPGLFPQRRVKKIYQTGSSAAGFIGYPPS